MGRDGLIGFSAQKMLQDLGFKLGQIPRIGGKYVGFAFSGKHLILGGTVEPLPRQAGKALLFIGEDFFQGNAIV